MIRLLIVALLPIAAFAQDRIPQPADGRDPLVGYVRGEVRYVQPSRRPAPTPQTRPAPQAATETVASLTYYGGNYWRWDGVQWILANATYSTPVYTVPTYYAVPTRRGYRYVAGDVCVSGT